MPNPKRSRIQEEAIRNLGGNIHLRDPNKHSEQIRMQKNIKRRLKGPK